MNQLTEVRNQKNNKTVLPKHQGPDNFSRDLIKLAQEGKLDPVVGREDEINRIPQILSRRKKNNPIILGEPGCVLGDTWIEVEKISDSDTHNIENM